MPYFMTVEQTKTNLLRYLFTYMYSREAHLCSLCIWIQPTFASKFGFGAGVNYGVSEILNIVSFINWVFRGMDFNDDALPEEIGYTIQEILVTDEIKVRPSTTANNITSSNQMNRLTAKSAMISISKQFKKKFTGCCVALGFIYENMAPSFSATNLRKYSIFTRSRKRN